jgi:hypothetical protein
MDGASAPLNFSALNAGRRGRQWENSASPYRKGLVRKEREVLAAHLLGELLGEPAWKGDRAEVDRLIVRR